MAISQWSDDSRSLRKPQLDFQDEIDNFGPFVPKITTKPNALPDNPLSKALLEYSEMHELGNDKSIFDHPYEEELEALVFPEDQLKKVTPQEPKSLEEMPCKFINKKEDLVSLIEKLRGCSEIAVDMENYSYRSYLGFVCLIQISTRSEDFMIDAVDLRSEIHLLNQIFTDPKIVKVFHGASEDIKWLQRDFGVYVVNMFDTSIAVRELGYQRSSLSFVLEKFCDIETTGHSKKEMQLADWRIRPIPEEMLKYAQRDTHFLLYIYDLLKNELIDTDRSNPETEESNIMYVLEESLVICYQRYRVQRADKFFKKRRNRLNENVRPLFKLLCQWRDKTAREEDESMNYVMTNKMLMDIVHDMPEDIMSFFDQRLLEKHPLVKKFAQEIQGFIEESRPDDVGAHKEARRYNNSGRQNRRGRGYAGQRRFRGRRYYSSKRDPQSEDSLQGEAENENARTVNGTEMEA